MCYGSGCSAEGYMGECNNFGKISETCRNSKYKSMCLVFGNCPDVVYYYLNQEEILEAETTNDFKRKNELANKAFKEWENDKELEEFRNSLSK